MRALILRWLLATAALWLTSLLLPGSVRIQGLIPALLATLAIGFLNALVRPLLIVFKVITLPLSILTLGLFALVVSLAMNIVIFYAVGHGGWIRGFSVPGFLAAAKAALVMSVINALLAWLLPGRERR